MKLIIMAQTVNLFISRGIAHELKDYESGASSITPKPDYIVIDYAKQNELIWE